MFDSSLLALNRPTATAILLHPFFWTPTRRLLFLTDSSDAYENLTRDPPHPMLLVLESGAPTVIGPGRDWAARMDPSFVASLTGYRKVGTVYGMSFRSGLHSCSILRPSLYIHL